jgi:hypothetical protein
MLVKRIVRDPGDASRACDQPFAAFAVGRERSLGFERQCFNCRENQRVHVRRFHTNSLRRDRILI